LYLFFQNKTKQNKTKQNKTKQNKTKKNLATGIQELDASSNQISKIENLEVSNSFKTLNNITLHHTSMHHLIVPPLSEYFEFI